MTYEELYHKIGKLTAEQRKKVVIIGNAEGGDIYEFNDLISLEKFDGTKSDQHILMFGSIGYSPKWNVW